MQFIYKNTSKINEEYILKHKDSMGIYSEKLKEIVSKGNYEDLECSINLVSDEDIFDSIIEAKNKLYSPKLKYIIVIGIGGSNLPAKAVYDAFYGFYENVESNRFPRIIFVDTVNQIFLFKIKNFLRTSINNLDELAIIISSKTGKTLETAVNTNIIISNLLSVWGDDVWSKVAVVCDENSDFWQTAVAKKIVAVPIPKKVGGRFSVFGPSGLLPLMLKGIDVEAMRKEAVAIRDKCLNKNIEDNPAALSAIILYELNKQGKTISDTFFFNPELESLGKWYRQLLGESIGKEETVDGEIKNVGITPTVSIGSTDLHSVAQLYFAGPKNRMTTFVFAQEKEIKEISLSNDKLYESLLSPIGEKTAGEITEAIYKAVKKSYEIKEMPFVEILLDDISPKSIGGFLQFKMMEIMYLGKLFNINTFDQPNVELYKGETKKLLSN